jgi:hypothetical protein
MDDMANVCVCVCLKKGWLDGMLCGSKNVEAKPQQEARQTEDLELDDSNNRWLHDSAPTKPSHRNITSKHRIETSHANDK